jgi:hypothetical protein
MLMPELMSTDEQCGDDKARSPKFLSRDMVEPDRLSDSFDWPVLF